ARLLGHACVLCYTESTILLCDPWLKDTHLDGLVRRFPDPGPLDFTIPKPSALLFSHHHWDHIHIPTLLEMDRDIPVYYPENPRMTQIFDRLGFVNQFVIEHWQPFSVGNIKIWPTASHVPFGECGFYLESEGHGLLNLVDSVFKLEDILKLNQIADGRIRVCLVPYQSYDEMGILLGKPNSLNRHALCVENARVITHLDCELIIPAADGLYYPGNQFMNQLGFFSTPFDFIDCLYEENFQKKAMIGMPLDELILHQPKVQVKRTLPLSIEDILSLYEESRSFVEGVQLPDLDQTTPVEDSIKGVWSAIFDEYFLCGLDRFPKEYLEEFQRLGARFDLIVLPDFNGYQFDFIQGTVKILQPMEPGNAQLRIRAEDLMWLLESKTLVNILMQSDRMRLSGDTTELAYRALDMLAANGLLDEDRISDYIGSYEAMA
ncbi:MAG: MBL fold metallo-hydrolase, partial [Candidatus Cloacimonetes bacterium]|nr:MBL fold metallo-hydrolase [Candidatus Cloacimonadota bacterium]